MSDDITIENMAKDVIELLDESAYICGLSLGGIVAQEIYKQAPDKVKGLILANHIDPKWHPAYVRSATSQRYRLHR
jgi:pimeloyl-ACP methyl ester carboxylesterase